MSIYEDTTAGDLERCFISLMNQTVRADEIVLVRDGPINSIVERCIENYESTLPFTHVTCSQNRGLGLALRDGLKICRHELIARVDSDDWSLPERFQRQLEFFNRNPKVSVVGSWLKEWYHLNDQTISVLRPSPLDYTSVQRTAKHRNPINHPTVMFRRTHILACGNYESFPLFEDYYLWAKMLMRGYTLMNIPETLVETEVDSDYFQRRGGLDYLKKEIHLATALYRIGFLDLRRLFTFTFTRLPVRLLPVPLRQLLYSRLLRTGKIDGKVHP